MLNFSMRTLSSIYLDFTEENRRDGENAFLFAVLHEDKRVVYLGEPLCSFAPETKVLYWCKNVVQ